MGGGKSISNVTKKPKHVQQAATPSGSGDTSKHISDNNLLMKQFMEVQ